MPSSVRSPSKREDLNNVPLLLKLKLKVRIAFPLSTLLLLLLLSSGWLYGVVESGEGGIFPAEFVVPLNKQEVRLLIEQMVSFPNALKCTLAISTGLPYAIVQCACILMCLNMFKLLHQIG